MKQILLFIVQDADEEDLLYPLLREKNGQLLMRFALMRSDLLSRRSTVDRAKRTMEHFVKEYMANHHLRMDDLCGVVQLTSIESIYHPEQLLLVNPSICQKMRQRIVYQDEYIYFDRPEDLKNFQRLSQQKRKVIKELVQTPYLFEGLPYHLYYFSRNLPHVLDLGEKESLQERLEEDGEKSYWEEGKASGDGAFTSLKLENFNEALAFFTKTGLCPERNYQASWKMLEERETHLLPLSNFGQILVEIDQFTQE